VKPKLRIPLTAAGLAYVLFAAGCFRLAVVHGNERGVSIGEGSFVLLGAAALFVAAPRATWQSAAVVLGTLPLVGWFLATPANSGPPLLVASLIAPCLALGALAHGHDAVRVCRWPSSPSPERVRIPLRARTTNAWRLRPP
jgi:hypothetical protein